MTAVVRGARVRRLAAVAPLVLLALVGVSGCGQDVDEGPKPTLAGTDTTLSTTNGLYGQVLSDAAGRTLYQFDGDRGGQPTCYGPCAQVWKPYIADGEPRAENLNLNPLEAANIDLVPRQDGTKQVAYQGHPLYFYSGDTAAAAITGAGKREFGGLWTGVTTLGNQVYP